MRTKEKRSTEREMGDESTIPLVMESIRASEVVITVHQARSHDKFRSPDLNFTVWSPTALSSQTAGSGWPERLRSRSDLLRTCHRHQVGTARPKARSDRRKWSGGLADGRVQSSVSELLQSAALCAKHSGWSKVFLSVKVVVHTQGVLGSHRGLPGGPGGVPSGAPRVPAAMDGSDAVSRRGKRVKENGGSV